MSPSVTYSYEKFNYLTRPSKQVERKLFVEALHRLANVGYSIYDYTYVGFGSIFYADFILFHEYLYIDKMICVEASDIPKRMALNKPFKFVQLAMKDVSDLIPELSRTRKYVVWLDYDHGLNADTLQDIDGLVQRLCPGSFLLVTVDAELRLPRAGRGEVLSDVDREQRLLDMYRQDFGHLLIHEIESSQLTQNELPRLLARIIRSQIQASMIARPDQQFFQLFNFKYADGAQMLTIGGLIDDRGARQRLAQAQVWNLDYVKRGEVPLAISVPPLTVREKQLIDSKIDRPPRSPKILFELNRNQLRNYVRFYRHYPVYYESVL
jgi:hypothetical protein